MQQRGIRVIPELDAPAHAGAGWNFGEKAGKGKLTLCNDPVSSFCILNGELLSLEAF